MMKKTTNHITLHAPNSRGCPRCSLRDYGFCMATLLLFCLSSLLYQLNGGAPQILLDLRLYLGNSTFLDDHGPPTPKALPFPSQVVYNRVGKCGSRTVVLLLRILSEKHGFNLVTSDIHNKTRLTKSEQRELIRNISTAEQPYLFTRHVHFLNFSRFGAEQPVYINIIRDPVNRFLSNYFFRRFGDWRGEQNHMIRTPGMKEEERYLDINECILENYAECSNPRLFYIIPYFCGQHPKCRDPGEWALERAKQNVKENFLLVGILEELEDVLLLLERFLPHYFKDVMSIYKNPGGEVHEERKSCTRQKMGPLNVVLVAGILYRPNTGSETPITVTLPPQTSDHLNPSSASSENTERLEI
ncbi:uronyl 2-sulfotransferase isoform X2 [Dendropsophus ebraccatus]|uniref:uronyl 2-sulfotransferase isoform X2 n=1 Tax=Dendropsophus ebraccatus TaxID=150705 RepID=UPI0038313706